MNRIASMLAAGVTSGLSAAAIGAAAMAQGVFSGSNGAEQPEFPATEVTQDVAAGRAGMTADGQFVLPPLAATTGSVPGRGGVIQAQDWDDDDDDHDDDDDGRDRGGYDDDRDSDGHD